MWPSIPAFRSFGNVICPSGASCELPFCIFEHESAPSRPSASTKANNVAAADLEPEPKRLKLYHSLSEPSISDSSHSNSNVFVGSILPREKPKVASAQSSRTVETTTKLTSTANESKPSPSLPRSATRPVSPPPIASVAKSITKPDVPTPLMPRKLNKEPVLFTKRITLLKALHGYMKPHNDKMAKAVKPEIQALHMTPNQLNRLAVDEEEQIAKANPSVYENVLKQRLVKLRAMTPEAWVKERRGTIAKERGDPPKKQPPKRVDTGLTPKEEITMLSMFNCAQDGLDAHGYVTKLPTKEELEEAQKVYEAAGFWEECDRCRTRFQVFNERREEDGALTTGGQCRHHWGKRIFPKKNKNAAVPEPTKLSCCNEPVGSPGCAVHDTHVYNVKDSKRLSLNMRFIETPENDKAPPQTAVCFDCEMGYTTQGLELLRLTAISWPQHKPLIDVLVRPLGHLLDVNTRFSGVTAEQFLNAKSFDPKNPKPVRNDLRIVDSPHVARDLFLEHISPNTPVLGHALENDLNTIRLIHPTIIDTVILYPTRQGLPFRHGLRTLAKWHLNEDIQQGGAAGHDSFEDARTTGELVRFKIKEKWKELKNEGWAVRDDGVFPPLPKAGAPEKKINVPSMVPVAQMTGLEGGKAVKRKFEEDGDTEEDVGDVGGKDGIRKDDGEEKKNDASVESTV